MSPGAIFPAALAVIASGLLAAAWWSLRRCRRLERRARGLAAEGERYRGVVESWLDGVLVTDTEDRILYANSRMEELTGFRREEMLGAPSRTLLFSQEQWPRSLRQRDKRFDGVAASLEVELRCKDGDRFWAVVNSAPLHDAAGAALGTVLDVRERERAAQDQERLQAAIENAAREWLLTFDAVESPLVVVDAGGRVRRLNFAASKLAGKGYGELLGLKVEDLGGGEPWQTASRLVAEVGQRGTAVSTSVVDPQAGKTWDLAASLSTGWGAEGDRTILVARDITRLARLQESLRRSEVLSAMGSLVSGVAHEVRNPLFGISAALDAFENRFGDREDERPYISVLRSQLTRLNDLMQELLEYGKPPALHVAPAAMGEVIAEALANCSSLAVQEGVALATELEAELPPVAMDRGRILQVFQNLLENSIQHTPGGGTVAVRAKRVADSQGEWVTCQVRDSGPGFRPDDLPRVFEPFFTRRREGTGLGLSIVHRIIEEHGGRITAGNLPQAGAVMEVRLPVAAPTPDAEGEGRRVGAAQ